MDPAAKARMQVAALSLEINQGGLALAQQFLIFPEGQNIKARDGRPEEIAGWTLDATYGHELATALNQNPQDTVIDYEHQSLHAKTNGKPAPAAGWIRAGSFEYVEGAGLTSNSVSWTPEASEQIKDGRYKYKSPLVLYTPDGRLAGLHSVAITNTPALLNLDQIDAAALSSSAALYQHQEEPTMKKTIALLAAALGLAVDAGDEAFAAALSAGMDQIKQQTNLDLMKPEVTLADLSTKLSELNPDPSKFAPLSAVTALQDQVAKLTAASAAAPVEAQIQAALSDGRLLPAMEGWARDYATKDAAGFSAYLDKAPKVAALTAQQSQQQPAQEGDETKLEPTAAALATQFGNDPAEVAKNMAQLKQEMSDA